MQVPLAALGRIEDAKTLVARALAAYPDLSIELVANEPGYNEMERLRFVETMSLAGFPRCAGPESISKFEMSRRLPGCIKGS